MVLRLGTVTKTAPDGSSETRPYDPNFPWGTGPEGDPPWDTPEGIGDDPFANAPDRFTAPFNLAGQAYCPLILDLDGNGVQVTYLADGVHFDHDGNGFMESTAWVSGNDGLLVWDKNLDGKITTGNELFGDRTFMKNGRWGQNGTYLLPNFNRPC